MQRAGGLKFGWERWKLRLFLCALILGALAGLGNLGEPAEDWMRDLRNLARRHQASGQVVIVAIDDPSIRELSRWPWPRRYHGELVRNLTDAGASHIYFDVDFSSTADDDDIFEKALAESKRKVTLPAHFVIDPSSGHRSDLLPIPRLQKWVDLATINVRHNYRGQVKMLAYSLEVHGKRYPSFAAAIAGRSPSNQGWFPIDYSIDPRSIPKLSAAAVIRGESTGVDLRGKTVVIGTSSRQVGDTYMLPGYGLLPGVYLHAVGAETLLKGNPVLLGWFPAFAIAGVLMACLLSLRRTAVGAVGAAGAALCVIACQGVLEERLIFTDSFPALFGLLLTAITLGWSSLRQFYTGRGSRNSASGLPNLNVLRQGENNPELPLVVAKVHNYAEIASAFTSGGQDALVKQIADRLALVSPQSRLYQSDDGIFAWFDDEETETAHRSPNTLYDLFRRPMLVLGTPVDVSVTFGIDGRIDQPVETRLGSAIVAADDVLQSGLKWKECDQTQLAQTARKLSLMGQLDRAMANEEIWIAFQPKLDIATDQIIGAEALVRWDHFDNGEIEPLDFILAAERSGRIAELTDYVLIRALDATAKLRRAGIDFSMAVNLSGMLIDSKHLSATISKRLAAYGVLPEQLTLEITETAALAGHGGNSRTLAKLREMGVEVAIDDYGTGLSTLQYLKRIPATELKIDKSFIQAIDHSEADRLMVQSTINLAHSLGRKVVAEGVERRETLDRLRAMECDIAQGYLISRPLPYDRLEKLLVKRRRAA